MHPVELMLSPRLRTTPYEQRVFEQGVKSMTIYNHMTLSVNFTDTENEYRHLCEHVQVWDVACLLYTSPSPRDRTRSRMPSSA